MFYIKMYASTEEAGHVRHGGLTISTNDAQCFVYIHSKTN